MKISRLYPEYAVLDDKTPEIEVATEDPKSLWMPLKTPEYRLTYTVEFQLTEAEFKEVLG